MVAHVDPESAKWVTAVIVFLGWPSQIGDLSFKVSTQTRRGTSSRLFFNSNAGDYALEKLKERAAGSSTEGHSPFSSIESRGN